MTAGLEPKPMLTIKEMMFLSITHLSFSVIAMHLRKKNAQSYQKRNAKKILKINQMKPAKKKNL